MGGLLRIAAIALTALVAASPAASAAPGDLDPAFSDDGFDIRAIGGNAGAADVAIQPDGKIVVAGRFVPADGSAARMVALRYLPDGELDPNFGSGGQAEVPFASGASGYGTSANGVALQPDGKIVLVGSTNMGTDGNSSGPPNFAFARLLPSGALDTSFHANGTGGNDDGKLVVDLVGDDAGKDVLVAPDGSIFGAGSLQLGTASNFAIVKVTPQGNLDSGFGSGGKSNADLGGDDRGEALALQADGRVVVVGSSTSGGASVFGLVRVTAGGIFDNSFDGDGRRTVDFPGGADFAADVFIDSAGKTVVAGTAQVTSSDAQIGVARLDPVLGTDDAGFGANGRATIGTSDRDIGTGMVELPGGKLVVVGRTDSPPGTPHTTAARLTSNGSPDAEFGNQPGLPGVARQDLGGGEDVRAVATDAGGDGLVLAGVYGEVPGQFLTLKLRNTVAPVAAPGPDPEGPVAPAPADAQSPTFAQLGIARTFRAAASGGSVGTARAKVGAKVTYTLSEAATVRFTVERRAAGRKVGRRCAKPTKRNRKRKKCTRFTTLKGSFTHDGKQAANSFKFTGRLSNRKLKPGRYRLVAVATDAAGNKSAARRSNFRIVRR